MAHGESSPTQEDVLLLERPYGHVLPLEHGIGNGQVDCRIQLRPLVREVIRLDEYHARVRVIAREDGALSGPGKTTGQLAWEPAFLTPA